MNEMKKIFLLIALTLPLMAYSAGKVDKAQADSILFALLSSDMGEDAFSHAEKTVIGRDGRKRGTVFVVEGENFQIKSLRNDVYYIAGRNECVPVDDARYPMETMNNLLLGKIDGGQRDITVHHHQYGGHNATLFMPFDELRSKLQPGMKAYCSITAVTTEKIEGVLVYHDVTNNVIHMLQISSPLLAVTSGQGEMEAELYTNIPQDNIRNLFGVEDELNSPVVNPVNLKSKKR